MKIGNLAIVVATHPDAKMTIEDGQVTVANSQSSVFCSVTDEACIAKIIAWLNFGVWEG